MPSGRAFAALHVSMRLDERFSYALAASAGAPDLDQSFAALAASSMLGPRVIAVMMETLDNLGIYGTLPANLSHIDEGVDQLRSRGVHQRQSRWFRTSGIMYGVKKELLVAPH